MCLFRSKTDINESLGGSLEMCSAGVVVSQLQCIPFVRQTHKTLWLREAPSQHQEVPLQRTIEKLVELVESYLASSSCKLWHKVSIEFSCEQGPQTCLCLPKSTSTVSCPHLCTLALEQSRRHLQNVPSQSLHVSQPTQDLRADTHRWRRPRIFPSFKIW